VDQAFADVAPDGGSQRAALVALARSMVYRPAMIPVIRRGIRLPARSLKPGVTRG
jgi:hypothetical protein